MTGERTRQEADRFLHQTAATTLGARLDRALECATRLDRLARSAGTELSYARRVRTDLDEVTQIHGLLAAGHDAGDVCDRLATVADRLHTTRVRVRMGSELFSVVREMDLLLTRALNLLVALHQALASAPQAPDTGRDALEIELRRHRPGARPGLRFAAFAARALPPRHRPRWILEWWSELHDLRKAGASRGARTAYRLRVLAGVWTLRRALRLDGSVR